MLGLAQSFPVRRGSAEPSTNPRRDGAHDSPSLHIFEGAPCAGVTLTFHLTAPILPPRRYPPPTLNPPPQYQRHLALAWYDEVATIIHARLLHSHARNLHCRLLDCSLGSCYAPV